MVFRQIKNFLVKYPPVRNALTYGTLFCTAEFSQQYVLRKYLPEKDGKPKQDYDVDRLKRYAFLGYFVFPNMMTVWYKWLDTRFTATTTRVVMTKVFLDQTLLTIPILFIFFTSMSYLDGKKDITAEFFEKFPRTYATSWAFWMPAQTFNFKFIPPTFRIPYNGACSFVWANILCFLKRMGEDD